MLQEYSPKERKLIGERELIFKGTPIGFTEAPHLYKRNGYYYLITAEGGTGWGHAVTMARSRNLTGPYELHPDVYILSARHRPDVELQRAGHADLVETQNGETYMVYLCGRPLRNRGRCTLGRETAIQPMVWSADGWLRTTDGQGIPQTEVPAPALASYMFDPPRVREEFVSTQLPIDFQWLRTPWPDELFSLTARPGHLRLYGRESIGSHFRQALVARRQQSHCFSAQTVIEFEPEHFQQMAGLVCYYNSAKFHYLYISHDETLGKHLRVMSSLPGSGAGGFVHAAHRDSRRQAHRAPGGDRLRAPVLRLSRRRRGVAVAAAAVRRQHPLGRSERARRAEFHRRVRRHGVPGHGGRRAAGGFRLVRVSRAGSGRAPTAATPRRRTPRTTTSPRRIPIRRCPTHSCS